MRLIDADRLKFTVYTNGKYLSGSVVCVIEDIDNAPTVEAKVVERGVWKPIYKRDGRYQYDEIWAPLCKCSCCKEEMPGEWKYCANCGAKMEAADGV